MNNDDVNAVIDIGSNSIRCMIAKTEKEEIKVLAKDLVTTRLGKGLLYNGNIRQDSIEKSINVLRKYVEMTKRFNAKLCCVVGTSALREAKNAEVFINKTKKEIGIEVDIISGTKEAFLSAKGALHGKDPEKYLVFDLGGGSMELISQQPEFVESIDIGAVKLLERFKEQDDYINLDELYKEVIRTLDEKIKYLKGFLTKKNFLLGLGGTATSFPMLQLGIEKYDRSKIQDYFMSKKNILEIISKLNKMNIMERKKIKGMPLDREDIIVPGGGIIWAMLDYLVYDGYYASDRDLLYGILYEEMFKL